MSEGKYNSVKIKTKYGEIKIVEDEKGAVSINYNTLYNVFMQPQSTNKVVFHIVKPYNNVLETY